MRGILLVMLMAFIAWVPPPAEGGGRVFAWQGPDGSTHFSDRPAAPGAQLVHPGRGHLSIVETVPAGGNAMRPIVNEGIRREQKNRQRERREALAEMARHEKQCSKYREQLAAAERARLLARVRELEEQWFARCR